MRINIGLLFLIDDNIDRQVGRNADLFVNDLFISLVGLDIVTPSHTFYWGIRMKAKHSPLLSYFSGHINIRHLISLSPSSTFAKWR